MRLAGMTMLEAGRVLAASGFHGSKGTIWRLERFALARLGLSKSIKTMITDSISEEFRRKMVAQRELIPHRVATDLPRPLSACAAGPAISSTGWPSS